MKDGETSAKKSAVKFDETKNTSVEFYKQDKLEKEKHIKKGAIKFENDNLETPLKRQATPRAPLDENINTANISDPVENKNESENATKPKVRVDEEQIEKLKQSSVVMQARDNLALSTAPSNFYQFERDMKSFKNEGNKKI